MTNDRSAGMTHEEFVDAISKVTSSLAAVLAEKNAYYTPPDDAFANWRTWGVFGIAVRLGDKLCRLVALCLRGRATLAELVEVLTDIAGYALCALAWVKHGDEPLLRGERDGA